MKTIYIDAGMGAAGDMLTAALIELFPDKEHIVSDLNALGLPGITFSLEVSEKCGIKGSHMNVVWNEMEEGLDGEVINHHHHEHDHHHEHEHHHEHHHEHEHEHHHNHEHTHEHHHHSSLRDIEGIIFSLKISDSVKKDILAGYTLIAEAESKAHGKKIDEIHFHEVGTMDAVADVTAVCYLMSLLNPDKVIVSPIHVGSGSVRCAHGILPVPAPATAHILQGCPIYSTEIKGELCTPTGAALLKHFASSFGAMPILSVSAIGYGMGKKDFEKANCVRAFLGEEEGKKDCVIGLECNIDDMTAEEIGFAIDRLLLDGALDVYTIPMGMKKNRPGVLLSVLCKKENKDEIVKSIFINTTTLGIRETEYPRYVLERKTETIDSEFGPIRKKISYGYGVKREKLEYDDVAKAAKENGLSLMEVRSKLN